MPERSKMPRYQGLNGIPSRTVMFLKVALSATMFLMTCCYGMGATIYGPTLPDLQKRYKSSVEDLSKCFALQNPGMLISSLLGGIINDRFLDQTNLIMGTGIFLGSFGTLLVPWCRNHWLLSIICFIHGIGQGLDPSCQIPTLTSLWGSRSALPIHIVTNGWPVGMTLVPLLCRNFISNIPSVGRQKNFSFSQSSLQDTNVSLSSEYNIAFVSKKCDHNDFICQNLTQMTSNPFNLETDIAPIHVPYIVVSLLGLVCTISFLVLYCLIPREVYTISKKSKTSWKDTLNPGSCTNGKVVYGAVLMMFFALSTFSNAGALRVVNFLYSYLIDSGLNFSRDEAVLLLFATNLSAVCSRILISFIVIWCPIQIVLFVEQFGSLISSIGMLILGRHNKTLLWLCCIASFAFHAPIYPGKFVWLDRYIIIYSIIGSIATMSIGVSGYFFEWFNGYLYTNISPVGILYNRVGCFAVGAVILIMMQILASYHGERDRDNRGQMDEYQDSDI